MREYIGISDIAVCIPDERITVSQLSQLSLIPESVLIKKTGVKEFPVLSSGQAHIDLAIKSTKDLIKNCNVSPSKIDIILFCSCGIQDQYMWSPAAKVQQAIKAKNAFSFEISNGCNAGNLGINIASAMLKNDATKKIAIVVVCDALSRTVNRNNKDHLSIFNFADASTSILIMKGEKRNNILSTVSQTIPDFVDHLYIPYNNKIISMSKNSDEDKLLSQTYIKMYPKMIKSAIKKANLRISDISYLLMNQGDHGLIKKIPDILNIPENKIFRSHENFGHMGGSDVFFGMKQLAKGSHLKPDDIIVLASSAIGFSWAATVIQI